MAHFTGLISHWAQMVHKFFVSVCVCGERRRTKMMLSLLFGN